MTAAFAYRAVAAVERFLGRDPSELIEPAAGVDDCDTCDGTQVVSLVPAIGPRVVLATVTCPGCGGTGEAGAA